MATVSHQSHDRSGTSEREEWSLTKMVAASARPADILQVLYHYIIIS
jgi:hypothetical protein